MTHDIITINMNKNPSKCGVYCHIAQCALWEGGMQILFSTSCWRCQNIAQCGLLWEMAWHMLNGLISDCDIWLVYSYFASIVTDATCWTGNAHSFRNNWFQSLWGVHDSTYSLYMYIHFIICRSYVYVFWMNLVYFAWVSLTALSRTYSIAQSYMIFMICSIWVVIGDFTVCCVGCCGSFHYCSMFAVEDIMI